MSNSTEKPRKLGRGLASLLGSPVTVSAELTDRKSNVATATPHRGPVESEPAGGEEIVARPGRLPESTEDAQRVITIVDVDSIIASPWQPRTRFDEGALAELAASIKSAGVMQPILLRRSDGANPAGAGYELVAGERRWRAARQAGLGSVPAIVVDLTDQEAAEWALIENVQRADLGPVERARGMQVLAERFSLTHATIGERLGLDRSAVTNHLRLLELGHEELALVEGGRLTLGHAKVALALPEGAARSALLSKAATEGWTVRRLEVEVREALQRMGAAAGAIVRGGRAMTADEVTRARALASQIGELEKRLMEHLGTKVHIVTSGKGTRGKIVVEFYSVEEFEGVVDRMGLTQ